MEKINSNHYKSAPQGNHVLASISYFSLFFAPIIVPIIVWIFADKPTSQHASKSLVYHIITYLGPIIALLTGSFGISLMQNATNNWITIIVIIIACLLAFATVWYTIKNVYRGVSVLTSESSFFNP
ncbi:DUF4870 domain-containing protein [Staphylococcus gallinarum]|jgi:chromate transport protein ChrA|uniref:DUF4870 domain-containing protein n=1 Tax=Staphylococcus gallinarum TaxID=1293 RepID=A0A0D0SJS2_STAGA|nr:DUF4870 domain-containing protein [Staphylococcus gallinarum]KIR12620.1 hypothetical protein SH09_00240 [Staphylococcus gallinarum]MBU7216512.1 DUF4870 domain-containing protein [Staphylococcus gallinarum]MCD8785829.1 DUF4870 domain-containing protein [Staphylococcus gallinarum]MCD8793630.1 DUF4870 domain-containing protein [Staphylococcus gallinarum]MCD8858537.1 DUF4870 domain-containing protein [Staphylococcus gallinarum]